MRLSLIHQNIDAQQLDQAVEYEIELLLQGGPLERRARSRS
jgi:hypothetical protein